MNEKPVRFAVLLCTHNGADFLAEQLDSLLAQTRLPELLVIHDWGSKDATWRMVERYRAKHAARLRWVLVQHQEAPGACQSFLRALSQTLDDELPFDFLFFCDQDDIWHATKLETFAKSIASRPDAGLVYCDVALVHADGSPLAENYLGPGGAFGRPMSVDHPSTLFVNTVSGMSMAISRHLLIRGRSCWTSTDWVMHDWAMTIYAFLTEAPVVFIPSSLVNYRQHAGNLVGGMGQRRRTLRQWWRKVRSDVKLVHNQYRYCASLNLHQLDPRPGRLAVAICILRGRSFRPLKALKVALGYWVLWTGGR